jgi:hypothetical protein
MGFYHAPPYFNCSAPPWPRLKTLQSEAKGRKGERQYVFQDGRRVVKVHAVDINLKVYSKLKRVINYISRVE